MLPKRRNSALSSPGIMRNTRCCSGIRSRVWKPTRFHIWPARSSRRSCTTACGSRPVRGSGSPTGFIGPKRSVSRPRRAISSTGRQPSKYGTSSNSCPWNWSAAISASMNALVLLPRPSGR